MGKYCGCCSSWLSGLGTMVWQSTAEKCLLACLGTVDPNTVSCLPLPVCTPTVCGPSAEELVVFCAFLITTPIAPVTQLKVAQRLPTEGSARPITCHRLSESDQANKGSQTTSELYKCFLH